MYARSAFDKRYRNIANGKELRSKWKTDIRTDLCESCRAWTRVCNGTGTEFGASSWTELHAQVHNSFDNWLRTLLPTIKIGLGPKLSANAIPHLLYTSKIRLIV